MKDYDGWTIKSTSPKGKPILSIEYIRETKSELIDELKCMYDGHWGTIKKKGKGEVVKVKLVEVGGTKKKSNRLEER